MHKTMLVIASMVATLASAGMAKAAAMISTRFCQKMPYRTSAGLATDRAARAPDGALRPEDHVSKR